MAETYTGEVRNGVVVFDAGATPPPEGTKVRVEPAAFQDAAEPPTPLLDLIDRLDRLPSDAAWPVDAAAQHDHYLYGAPKRP